jgi:signal transduction histidine kinase
MASSVGHELRNPLAVITSALYYLKLVQPDADEKIKKYLDVIQQEVRTSEKIITDLLDFARVKSVDREAVSVSDLVRQTLERFPSPASGDVSIDIPADLPRAYVDLRQMIQVLGNLTVNACQAMKDGGKLNISAIVENNFISIAVKDSGIGISAENMKKLFEPLFTTKPKGIGLGLAVSKKLIEANGGRIEVESEAGLGSTFTVWLPVK